MQTRTRILFLCSGNSARSQMAEALLKKLGGDQYEVFSAGLEPKPIHPLTIKVLEEIGIDWSHSRAKPLSEFIGKSQFDYLITVCSRADERCPFFPGMGERLHWPFDDPAAVEGTDAEKLAAFRMVRDQIEEKVRNWSQKQQNLHP